MRSHVKRAFVIAAVAVFTAWIGIQTAGAKDYPGPYDNDAGQYYAQEARAYQRWLNPNGSMMVAPSPSIYFPGAYAPAYPYAAFSSTEGYYTPSTGNYSYGAFAPQNDRANIRVILPRADAKVWFSDSPTEQTGQIRQFVSPKLDPNKQDYTYEVKARWEENGKPVTRTQRVKVSANSTVSVDFTR
jgi:uncharacterized protein (TIGR03000 family)